MMAGVAAVLVCLVLLSVGVDTRTGMYSCGSVLAPETSGGGVRLAGCSGPLDSRMTLSLVIGAVGVAAFFGASN